MADVSHVFEFYNISEGEAYIEFLLYLVVEKKQLDKQQMEEYLYSRLPYYMIPKHMHCLEQFPLNTSSKTDRKKIQELI